MVRASGVGQWCGGVVWGCGVDQWCGGVVWGCGVSHRLSIQCGAIYTLATNLLLSCLVVGSCKLSFSVWKYATHRLLLSLTCSLPTPTSWS